MSDNNKFRQPGYFLSRCEEIVKIISVVHSANAALVTQWDAARRGLWIRAAAGVRENDYFVGQFIEYDEQVFCFRVLQSSAPLDIVNRASESPEQERLEVSYFGFPLAYPDGNIFGTMCIMEGEPVRDMHGTRISLEKFRKILEGELAELARLKAELPLGGIQL